MRENWEEKRILIQKFKKEKVERGTEIEIFMMSYVMEGFENMVSACL